MSIRRWSLASACVAALCIASFGSQAAGAAVVCQKGKLIKLRADACKPGFTTLATIGGGAGDPSGTWEFDSGTLFRFPGFVPRVLSLQPDGSGRLNTAVGETGIVDCEAFNYVRGETPTLALSLGSIESSVPVVRYSLSGQDELDLVGPDGQTAKLARVDHADPAQDCTAAEEVTVFTDLPEPHFASGLAFDGNQLWYTLASEDQIVPVDPASGAAGTPVDFGTDSFDFIHASAGADFWARCNCGGDEDAARIHGGNTVADLVQTADELHLETSIDSIAFDPPTNTLWLSGFDNDDRGVLLQIDPSGEPDVLVQTFDVGTGFVGLAFDGTNLWGLQFGGQSLTRIDPTTGQATGNFTVQSRVAQWQGVAVVGDELVLLGDNGLDGAILKLKLPADVGHSAAPARTAARARAQSGGSLTMRRLAERFRSRGAGRRAARADAPAR